MPSIVVSALLAVALRVVRKLDVETQSVPQTAPPLVPVLALSAPVLGKPKPVK